MCFYWLFGGEGTSSPVKVTLTFGPNTERQVSSSLDARPCGFNETKAVLFCLAVVFFLLWEIYSLKVWSTGRATKKIAQKRNSMFLDLYTLQYLGRVTMHFDYTHLIIM